MAYKKKFVFPAACFGMLLFGMSLITLGTVATSLKTKFLLDGIASGTLFSILPVGILVGSIFFGPICDRYGYRILLVAACIAMFAGFEGIAVIADLTLLKVSIFIFGVGGGIINGATNAVVADISGNNRGADLSLLGVFFGIGALGMPLLIGAVAGSWDAFEVLAAVGWLAFLAGIIFYFIEFPPAKTKIATASNNWRRLLDAILILIAIFLFCQSSLEAIINNWTTTYLVSKKLMSEEDALFALSIHIVGMVVMRLLTGSLWRRVSSIKIMWSCLVMLFTGMLLMHMATNAWVASGGLFLSGAGVAAGFPVMLGFVGERFSTLSGTAFSFVFTIALIGNMAVNYIMGVIVHRYGVQHLVTVSYCEIGVMMLLSWLIAKKLHSHKTTKYVSETMA